jgi:hypothetical protein
MSSSLHTAAQSSFSNFARTAARATLPALMPSARAAARWLLRNSSFSLRISRSFCIVSLSVAIASPCEAVQQGPNDLRTPDLAGRQLHLNLCSGVITISEMSDPARETGDHDARNG